MINEKILGFGCMRFPQLSKEGTDIDYEQVNKMFDLYLERGFTYFDTSAVYHGGASEDAIRECLVKRHDRNSFTIATKYPTFAIIPEEKVDETIQGQIEKLGVEYIDYYLLHNLNRVLYKNEVQTKKLFEHVMKFKEEGKIKHIGFSYHDDADTLDKILTEHPEVEFVQIAMNYYDWEEPFIQAHKCYDVIRKHGCKVVVMEPVKGGMLANVPENGEKKLRELEPNMSMSSWAIRWCASHDEMLAVLSGMSNLEQVEDNTSYMMNFKPLSENKINLLENEIKNEFVNNWKYKTDDWSILDNNKYNVPISGVIRNYNSCMIQPNPYFAAELNYYKSFRSAYDRSYETGDYSELNDKAGFDVNEALKESIEFNSKNSFQGYIED